MSDMNERIRQATRRNVVTIGAPDPEAILDALAEEARTDPDAVLRLDPATRRRLVEHLAGDEVIRRAVAERQRRPAPTDDAA